MRKIFVLSLYLMAFSSCVEDYDLYRDVTDSRLVVEGLITNKPGPYYIRLTESQNGSFKDPDYYNIDAAIPVKNAQIIISDNINQIDTLIPIDVNLDEYTLDRYGYYKLLNDDAGNFIDTLYLEDPVAYYDRGFYKTQNLVGIPGRTYSLKVLSEGRVYQAIAFMPPVPDIDSISFIKKDPEPGKSPIVSPLLYFSEPQGINNYYLIQLNEEVSLRSYSAGMLWQFSILSDEFLQPYVNGLKISQGQTPRSIEYPIYWEGDSFYVALSSLTRDAYEFFKILIQQFKNDGGAYQPAPGSPPTNMSNGALGLFRASAISEKRIKIPDLRIQAYLQPTPFSIRDSSILTAKLR
jgi:hypothetical protein